MKKILGQTIFLSLCLLSGVAFGQGTGYLYHNSLDGWQNKIRYHNGIGKNITYSWAALGTENHFALSDMGMMVDAHVADGYYVQDFEEIGDFVFFCGYNASSSGFLGWFDINEVFYGAGVLGRAYIDETLSAYGIENLDNIEVYYDKLGRIHIAGVGEHIVSLNVVGYKAFEAVGYTPTGMQYKVADLYGGQLRTVPKLAVTDDFVVYETPAYSVYTSGIGYTLEPFPKNDMFTTTIHPVYFFQTAYGGGTFPDATDPYLSSVGITHKEGNIIAICNYRCGVVYAPSPYLVDNNFVFVLREYDLSPLLYSNPIQMISDSRVKLPLDVSNIRKLLYEPTSKYYLALLYHETSMGIFEDGIMALDYSSGAAPTFVQTTYQQIYSNGLLCDMCLNGGFKYTASGFDLTYHNYYFWHDDIFSNAATCAYYKTYTVEKKPVEEVKELDCVSNVVGWIVLNFLPNIEAELYYKPNELDCN